MIIGTVLAVAGIYRSVASIALRFLNWGWALVGGIAAFVLGAMLLKGWNSTSLWFLGFALGIDLTLQGFAG
jgi:uncharacterized membrane protein HdeD (DUF308 family)